MTEQETLEIAAGIAERVGTGTFGNKRAAGAIREYAERLAEGAASPEGDRDSLYWYERWRETWNRKVEAEQAAAQARKDAEELLDAIDVMRTHDEPIFIHECKRMLAAAAALRAEK